MFIFGSLFAGIGGFDLGLENAGMQCRWQVEIDPYCQQVLAKHWPNVPRFGDIRTVGKDALEKVDLICGGFPCQPFSVAGKRRGKADDRYLWPEMLRIISEVRPTWVLGENVPGIIPMELDTVLADLEGEGYETQTFVIPACAVDAPHRRDRVWIVGYASNPGRQQESRSAHENESTDEGRTTAHPNQSSSTGQDVADTDGSRFTSSWNDKRMGRKRESIENTGNHDLARWSPEPGVGRVVARISLELDGGRLDEEMDSQEKSAKRMQSLWEDLREMWSNRESRTTSSELFRGNDSDSLRTLPHNHGSGAWNQKEEETKELLDMWERVSTVPFQEAHDLLKGMLERVRQAECHEKMASWLPEPDIPRVSKGVPDRVNRLRALGNAVVPQVVEVLGRMILDSV